MFDNLDFSKAASLLSYNVEVPMIFSSGIFLFLFLGFLVVYALLSNRLNARLIFVTLFSLFFYYKSSGWYFLILVAISLSDYFIGHRVQQTESQHKRKALVALSLIIDLGVLGYFKYTNLLIEFYNSAMYGNLEFQDIFLPVGISFFTFQSISYVIDIYRKRIAPLGNYLDYLFYISFFPQLVAGPIVRAHDFVPQIRRNPVFVSKQMFGEAVFLIATGLFKKGVISDYISLNFVDRVFDSPSLFSGVENLLAVYGYAIQIYCDFSGYSDMAIGIALLLGFRFNINFNSPYKSATITEFWRRWHISLSSWLKDYLYIPLGGNRKGKFRAYFNLIITMLLGGLWHGAAFKFIIWGAIHGVALAVHKIFMERFPALFKQQGMDMKSRFWRVVSILVTFHLVCFAWIFFRASSMNEVSAMLTQIFTQFNAVVFPQFMVAYKGVFLLILLGFGLHFMPDNAEKKFREIVTDSHFALQTAFVIGVIFLVMQTKSGDIQPFIYFQF